MGELVLGHHISYIGRGGAVERAPGVRQALDLAAVTGVFEMRPKDKLAIKACLGALIEEFSQDLEAQKQIVRQ